MDTIRTGCDLIVCWEHNWEECPLEVIELKTVIAEDWENKTSPQRTRDTGETDEGSENQNLTAD